MLTSRLTSPIEKLGYVLIVVFLLFSTQTTTRFLYDVIGPSELALVALMLLTMPQWSDWSWPRGPLLAWTGFLLILLMGWLGNHQPNDIMIHNALAYLFSMAASLFLLSYFLSQPPELLRRIVLGVMIVGFTVLGIGFFAYFFDLQKDMAFLHLNNYIPRRYSAWSTNPNQLALWFVPVPPLLAWLVKDLPYTWRTCLGVGLVFYIFSLMGLSVCSDALLLAWTTMALLVVALHYWLKFEIKRWVIIVLCLSLVAAYGTSKLNTAVDSTPSPVVASAPASLSADIGALGVGFGPDKLSVRSQLWRNSMTLIWQAPFFGHGPGEFAWLDDGPGEMESHNTFLDLLTQAGFLGTGIFAFVCVYIVRNAWQRKNVIALATLCGLLVFSMAHFVFRMPIFWYYLIFCYLITKRTESHLPCVES